MLDIAIRKGFADGCPVAFDEAYHYYDRHMRQEIWKRLPIPLREDIEDQLQQAWLNAVACRRNYDSKYSLWFWLYNVARRTAHHARIGLRCKGRDLAVSMDPQGHGAIAVVPGEQWINKQTFQAFCIALRRLSPVSALVVEMRGFTDMTHAEISELLHLKGRSSRTMYTSAKREIEQHLMGCCDQNNLYDGIEPNIEAEIRCSGIMNNLTSIQRCIFVLYRIRQYDIKRTAELLHVEERDVTARGEN